MVLNLDLAPTLLEIAGLTVPDDMQGKSIFPLAEGKAKVAWRKDWLYEYYEYPGFENVRPCRGVRTERYKLIHFFIEPQEFELYDLSTDPDEMNNLYGRPETQSSRRNSRSDLKHYGRRPTIPINTSLAASHCIGTSAHKLNRGRSSSPKRYRSLR